MADLSWGIGLAWGMGLAASPVAAQEAEFPLDYDAAVAGSGMEGRYGYVRTLEGSATLIQGDTGERVRLSANEPLLAGDRLFAAGESRIECLLADESIVRIGDRTEVLLRALANSADTNDPASVLELARGTLQLVVPAGRSSVEFPAVVTPNATIRARESTSVLIVVDDGWRSEVIVRDGSVEVTTATEVAEVRRGESLLVEGARGERLDFAAAPALGRLESWGLGLSNGVRGNYAGHLDPDLHYAASSLHGNGSWIRVEAGVAWRPRVAAGWAPYRHGRWRHTPSGLFWVSYDPWGWVPHHYGHWDLHPSWGWVWFPGRRFAGAHVYWYWGPSYAGWIPSGYYWRHYRNHYGRGWGFHFGVYGHIGGSFDRYRHWTFLPHGRLGHRRQHFYSVSGTELGRGRRAIERGVLLTDTRSLGRESWRRPDEKLAKLRRAVPRDGHAEVDANGFIDRGRRLPTAIERVALRGRDGRSAVPRPKASTQATLGVPGGRSSVSATTRPAEGRSPRLELPSAQRPGARRPSVQAPGVQRPSVQAPGAQRPSIQVPGVQRPRVQVPGVQRPSVQQPGVRWPPTWSAKPPGARSTQSEVGGGAPRPAVRRPASGDSRNAARRPGRPANRSSSLGARSARPFSQPAGLPASRPVQRSTRPRPRSMKESGIGIRRPTLSWPGTRRFPSAGRPVLPTRGGMKLPTLHGVGRPSASAPKPGGAIRRGGGAGRSTGVARSRGRSGGR